VEQQIECNNRDSGIGTSENGGASLDQSPEQEQSSSVLTGQYDENWENLRKIVEPNSSKSGGGVSCGSSSHHRHKDKSSKRRSRKHLLGSCSSDDTISSTTSTSSSASSSPISLESRDISKRAKFK
jgi:hypothetical protein